MTKEERKEYDRKRYVENKEAVCARNRAYWHKNKDKISAQNKIDRKARSPHHSAINRRSHLMKEYGLTMQEYDSMVEAQGGMCKICQTIPTKLVVDHIHGTKTVRGLVCNPCNVAIGFMKESAESMRRAAMYIEGVLS